MPNKIKYGNMPPAPAFTAQVALYVYQCAACGHSGQLHLDESTPEVTTACSACGAEVLAEWDGGVELTTTSDNGDEHG